MWSAPVAPGYNASMSRTSQPTRLPACSYDQIGEQEQAIVRKEWDERVTELRSNLDYAAKFTVAGESYSELDDAGEIKVHPAD